MRLQVHLELGSGRLRGRWLQAAREAQRRGPTSDTPLPQGSRFHAEMGSFRRDERRRRDKLGPYWLTPATASLTSMAGQGQGWDLHACLRAPTGAQRDEQGCVGTKARFPVRLRAVRGWAQEAKRRRERAHKPLPCPPKGRQGQVPGQRNPKPRRPGKQKRKQGSAARLPLADGTILLTTVAAELLSVEEALVLVRAGFQIERVWQRCKPHGQRDPWRSKKPERSLPEIVAQRVGVVCTHWLTLMGGWSAPNRRVGKAQQVVSWMPPCCALALAGKMALTTVVEQSASTRPGGCSSDSRGQKPNPYHLLAAPLLIRG